MTYKGYGKIKGLAHTDMITKGLNTPPGSFFYIDEEATVNRPLEGVHKLGEVEYFFKGIKVGLLDADNLDSYITDEEVPDSCALAVGEINGLATRVPRSTVFGGIVGVEDPYGYVEPGTYKGNT